MTDPRPEVSFTANVTPDGRREWVPSPLLLTPLSTLQGGAALGAAIVAMEHDSERPTIWATAQYLSFAPGTAPVTIDAVIETAGRNTTQARCTISRDGVEILTAHAALGRREFPITDTWVPHPVVPPPDDCDPYRFFVKGRGDIGDLAEFRLARGRQLDEIERTGERGDGSFALWARCWAGTQPAALPLLTTIADFMPIGFAEATGNGCSGNSLDNTVRVGHLVPTEWVLLSIHCEQIANGFGRGRADLWSEDGTLMATASQSVIMRSHARLSGTGPARWTTDPSHERLRGDQP